ncbi:acylphosphatase [Echinicola vietnamensis]|uniref:Acylphosphatase n=1 Tax=Echinicola vietnamensis (strain DSM 17526 / LMG 23754 / KMM 6221) TaxID=926556 RepID=L0FX36_ECHVK|nr:acylphosphatase [Echinicola vietnamensis]AGA77872.1 acylphosphatase [Echinicola vietnamensis DSM 17526]
MNKKYKILGKVQGVFFRKSTQEKAQEIGVKGWVKNEPDGSVLTVIQGNEEQVKAMEKWLKHGPPQAEVTALLLLSEGYDLKHDTFEIKR